jgi:hypothetical protein
VASGKRRNPTIRSRIVTVSTDGFDTLGMKEAKALLDGLAL